MAIDRCVRKLTLQKLLELQRWPTVPSGPAILDIYLAVGVVHNRADQKINYNLQNFNYNSSGYLYHTTNIKNTSINIWSQLKLKKMDTLELFTCWQPIRNIEDVSNHVDEVVTPFTLGMQPLQVLGSQITGVIYWIRTDYVPLLRILTQLVQYRPCPNTITGLNTWLILLNRFPNIVNLYDRKTACFIQPRSKKSHPRNRDQNLSEQERPGRLIRIQLLESSYAAVIERMNCPADNISRSFLHDYHIGFERITLISIHLPFYVC
jgi:hypothetical protein